MKVVGLALIMATSIFLSRILGVAEFGLYAVYAAASSILAAPLTAGMPNLLVKTVSPAYFAKNFGTVREFFAFTRQALVLNFALLIVVIATADAVIDAELGLFMWAVPMLSMSQGLTAIRSATLRSVGKQVKAQFLARIFHPVMHVIAIWVFVSAIAEDIRAIHALGILTFSHLLTNCLGMYWLRGHLNGFAGSTCQAKSRVGYLKQLVPMTVTGLTGTLLTNGIILNIGMLGSPAMAGTFKVAASISILAVAVQDVLVQVISPQLARLWRSANSRGLNSLLAKAAFATSGFSFWVVMIAITAGERIVIYLYGSEFQSAYWPMVVLTLARFAQGIGGCGGAMLMMSGNASKLGYSVAVIALTTLAVSTIFIHFLGTLGASLAMLGFHLMSLVTVNALSIRNTGMDPSVFGAIAWTANHLRRRK